MSKESSSGIDTEADNPTTEDHDVMQQLQAQQQQPQNSMHPDNWWKDFVKIVEESHSELKSPKIQDTPKENPLDWAVSVSSQILSFPSSENGKKILHYIVNSPMGIIYVMRMLEGSLHSTSSIGLSYILRECANPRNGSLRMSAIRQLIESEDYLNSIIKMLSTLQNHRPNHEANAPPDPENYTTAVNLIWLLSALAEKDGNFVLKVRTLSKVKFLHGIMKIYFFGKCRTHYPLLKIFRVLARNQKVAMILGKDKIMKLFVKIFNTFNNQPSTKFLLVFEILNQLTKIQENCRRFLKAGLLVSVMRAFSYWELWKGNGLLKLSKRVLSIYSHLNTIRAGRKALVQTDALLNIQKFCESCPNDRSFDNVIMKAVGIVYKAYGKDAVPLSELDSPAKFSIPKMSNCKPEKDSDSSSDEDDPEDLEDADDSDETGGELEDKVSNFNLHNETSMSDDELFADVTQCIVSAEGKSKGKKDSVVGTAHLTHSNNNAKGDYVHLMGSNSANYPPELMASRLTAFAPFFQELDGTAGDNINWENRSSIVLKLLRDIENEENTVKTGTKSRIEIPDRSGGLLSSQLKSMYLFLSNRTRSVLPFVKVAYPELVLAYGVRKMELISANTDRSCLRSKLLLQLKRASHELFKPKVVYDLDALLTQSGKETVKKAGSNNIQQPQPSRDALKIGASDVNLTNDDELILGKYDGRKDGTVTAALVFESRFESGNLRKAIQVGEKEYDLYLMSDVNSNRHNQWFYFQVSNTQENCSYTFNIMNCIKGNSQFNYGMQPVVYSVGDAVDGKGGWCRSGTNICYFRNGLRNTSSKKKKPYHTATFTLNFSHRGDICYIAYHYPYTYSRMLTEVAKLLSSTKKNKGVLIRYDVLCESLNHNEVPLLTITAANESSKPIELRDVIFLTSRVHPGESNSSWVMHGILNNLVSDRKQIKEILSRYVFKIIPMLNVEGVINGCHRCGLTNEDLNRRWKSPEQALHPSIYNAKGLVEFCCRVRNKIPALFCDLHGHSRKKNVFFYGCSTARSWHEGDRVKGEDPNVVHLLPEALARRSPAFSLQSCNFDVRKSRESTARVCMWRDFGISRSYTLESSYCGCDRGPYKGLSLSTSHLIEVGESLSEALEEFFHRPLLSASEHSITSPLNPTNDPSDINLCNLEDPSWSDKDEAPSLSSSETDFGNSETDDEWSQSSLNPLIS